MPAFVDPIITEALQGGSSQGRYYCDVFYEGVPTLTGVALLPSGNISRSLTSNINTSGRMYVASDVMAQDGSGKLIAPNDAGDYFAPAGQEIVIYRQVSQGDNILGAVSMGTFRITELPTITRAARRLSAMQLAITGVLLEVSFADRLEAIDADDFTSTQAPVSGNGTWAELRRLSPFPIVQTLPDAPVPATLVYSDSRIDSMQMLADNIGGVLVMTREGAVTVVDPDPLSSSRIPQVVLSGSIQSVETGMKNDYYNVVAVTSSTGSSDSVLSVASLQDGPRRARVGNRRVFRTSSPAVTNASTARAYAQRKLTQMATQRVSQVKVTCLPNVAVELGDIVQATDPITGRVSLGMVSDIDYDLDPTKLMTMTLDTRAGVQ